MTGAAHPLGPETEHYWLVQRMAKATGVDLVAAWDAEAIDHAAWSRLVTRCRGCGWAEGCHRWLDKPGEGLRACPEPCVNRARLARLRDRSGDMVAHPD